ncbi:MAG: M13 family metallopeptidase [Alphaproteobacteria bacterium]|nr:M13 family metallopeptidase [Alphaproteobacteria bacterium]
MRKLPLALVCTGLLGAGLLAALAQDAPRFGSWGVDLAAMDKSVKPGDNFSEFVFGTWQKSAVIPPDRSRIGGFTDLQILSEKRLRAIIDELHTRPTARLNPDERKLRDFYDSYMDTAAIEANGLKPAEKDLAEIAAVKTLDDVARIMASPRISAGAIYGYGIGVDDKHPDSYSLNLSQAGLGLPDRDYYLSDNPELVKTREAYRKYLADMMTLGGLSDAPARADRVMALETEIAKVQWTRADRRDADKIYNPMLVADLRKLAPEFPWDTFLKETGIPLTTPSGARYVIVAEKSAFEPLAKVFTATPIATWRDYLTVHYLHSMSAYLPKKFDDLDFALFGTVLTGRTQQLDRPTRGVHLLDGEMGEALGKVYVARYFPPEAKAKADALVGNLLKAMEQDIQTLDWMGPATKAKALEKVRQFTPKIGYPTKWRDYSALRIVRGDLIGNVQRSLLFEYEREVTRINKPVDRTEWGMTPSTINAYYNPSFNEIVFPAAILQPPFFDPKADDAVNYGAIGAVIGHEISHGFDDQGSKYDGKGVFQDWWTKEDRANFDKRTAMLVAQYDQLEPLPGLHVIGKNTLGENIADNAGLAIALKAYHLSLGGKVAPVLDGYSGDQRFLLGFGQVWRSKMRESAMRTQTLSNEHTVDMLRPIGATRNLDAWYDAFSVTPGQKYYLPPDQRVHLW